MLLFMFLDGVAVMAAVLFAIIPSSPLCLDQRSNTSSSYDCHVKDISTPDDCSSSESRDCICIGSVSTAFQGIPVIYVVLKLVAAGVLLKMVFRKKRAKRLQCKGVKQEWVFLLRLILSAVFLPLLGLTLVSYAAVELPVQLRKKVTGKSCLYSLPSPWWILAVLQASLSLMFVLEVIFFVCCPDRYLHGGRFSSDSDVQCSLMKSSNMSKTRKSSANATVKKSKGSKNTMVEKTKKTPKSTIDMW